jgi:hypothetical protein
MKYALALVLSIVLIQAAAAGETLAFANGKVSFVLPDGFTRMSAELAAVKYPRGAKPEHMFSDATTRVSSAAGFTPAGNLTATDLPELRDYLAKTMEASIPGIKWLVKDFKELGGAKWIYFEVQSEAVDTQIRNMMLFTAVDCGMVSVNFNSTLSDYAAHAAALARSRDSLKVASDSACATAAR